MSEVLLEIRDHVGLITLNAPSRRNALSIEMAQQLSATAQTAAADPEVGAVVISGREHFCAGAVRAVLADVGADPARDEAVRSMETLYGSFFSVGSLPVPTIAAVRGAAVGAGLNLALATDLRVVSKTARLVPGFAQIGIHPGGGHFTLLDRAAGRESAAAMGMFGQEISGARAAELGMAWAAFDDEEVEPEALILASQVAADPLLARRLVATFRRETTLRGMPWDVAIGYEQSVQMWSLRRKYAE